MSQTTTDNAPTQISLQEVISALDSDMQKLESQLEIITSRSQKIYDRTTIIMRTVFYSIGVLTLINFYFIFDFGTNIMVMMQNMQDMYELFGQVTAQVNSITTDVVSMSGNVELIPQISDKMSSMNNTVTQMTGNIHSMQGNVAGMNQDVSSINHNMTDMSGRFDNVNHSMDAMVNNVNQMSRALP
jgi:methyl-accepting chemotaxis protein